MRFTAGVITPAHKLGVICLGCAVALVFICWQWAWVPVALFLLLCAAAPFCFRFGFYLPLVSRGRSGRPIVALTFDDGPHPATTPGLLDLLDRHGVKATFFVVGQRAKAHPELVQAILSRGHTLGNHSYHHDPFLAFKGARRVAEEIASTQNLLIQSGVKPLVYRPPVGITYPSLHNILFRQELTAVTFSCRAGDRGNRSIDHLSDRILKRVRSDDIIMLHDHLPDHLPGSDAHAADFLNEVAQILDGLQTKNLSVRPLEELLGHPVNATPADLD